MIKPGLNLLLCLSLLLSACSDDDNTEPPAELVDFEPSSKLELLWSSHATTGINQQFLFIEPLLLNDTIVTAGRDGTVSVVDKNDGEILSEIKLDTTLSGGIGGNEKVWLFATMDGKIIAVDAQDRKVSWKVNVPSEVLSRPVLHKNAAFVRTVDGQVVSLDLDTGKINWSYRQTEPALTLRGSSSPVITRDRIFVGLANGRLVALSPKDGEIIWDIALAVPQGYSEIQRLVDIDGYAELFGNVLYAASYQGRVAAVDVQRGKFLWTRPFSSHAGVTLDAKTLYSSDDHSHVWALDRYNGATLWRQDKLNARNVTRPVLIGDYVVVGDAAGYLHVMSRFDGHFIARVQLGGDDEESIDEEGILVPPVIDGDNILVSTRSGRLYAYKLAQIIPVE